MKSFWRSSFLTLILVAADALVLAWLWLGAYALRLELNTLFADPINPQENYRQALPWLLPVWLLILARFRFYSHHERIAGLNRPGAVLWATIWMLLAISLYNLKFKPDFGRSVVGGFAAVNLLYLYGSRSLFRRIKAEAVRRGHARVRVVVAGAGELGRETMRRLHEHPDIGFRVAGYLEAGGDAPAGGEIEGYPVLGGLEALPDVVHRHRVEEVFFAIPDMPEDEIFDWIDRLQAERPVVCKVVANMLYVIVNRAKVDEIIGLPVVAFRGTRPAPLEQGLKRAIDLLAALALGLVCLPLMLLFALLIRLDTPGPVFFAHERVGQGGRRFKLWKFRTMRSDADPYAEAPMDQRDPRVTRFGAFLRRSSLDEIPQLWNILRGEMSLVGPRPEMPFIVETYKPWQAKRLEAKPGVTGLWQVAGRKNLPLHFNLEYDYYYVKNRSLALDLEILARTLPAVLVGRGAY